MRSANGTLQATAKLLRKARVALSPRSSTLRSRTPNGAVLLGLNRPGYGGRGAYIERSGLEAEVNLLPDLITPDSVLIDVGANTGLYTLTAAKLFMQGAGVVLALEPNVEILAMLARSLELNGFTNVRLRQLCAADRTGAVEFFKNFGKPNSYSMEARQSGAGSWSALAVELDQLVEWESLGRVDYVKIDAEGSEARILDGSKSLISRFRPLIQVEDSVSEVEFLPPGYVSIRLEASQNHLLVPSEHKRLDWLSSHVGRSRVQ